MSGGLIIKPFRVVVDGFGGGIYYARSRGLALAHAWRCDAFNGHTFGEFLRIARSWKEAGHERFGEEITVCGKPAYLVSWNSQYIQFVRPGSDVIMNSHPMDVDPPEARRGTPYYRSAA